MPGILSGVLVVVGCARPHDGGAATITDPPESAAPLSSHTASGLEWAAERQHTAEVKFVGRFNPEAAHCLGRGTNWALGTSR
jgi:hypothetical protein